MANQVIQIGTGHTLPPDSVHFPNWPVMLASCVQGARAAQIDPLMAADLNMLIVQSFKPNAQRMQDECDAIDAIWGNQDINKMRTKVYHYQTPNVTQKTLTTFNDGERLFSLQVMLDPVKGSPLISGSPTWKVHRVGNNADSGCCESNFSPTTDHQVNVTLAAGLNSRGETYAEALWHEYDDVWTPALKSRYSGLFHDVFAQVPNTLRQNNGATVVTDPDYNRDGVADIRTNFGTSGGNGGRQWCLGELNTIDAYKARFPDRTVAVNSALLPGDYNSGIGPLPINTQAPFYRKLDFPFQESVESFLSLTATGTGWTVAGTPGATGRFAAFCEAYYVQEAMARLESDMGPAVRGAVLMHSDCNNRVPLADDLDAMRFMALATMLFDRGCVCLSAGTGRVWVLDEMLVDFGNPIGTRSMGTFHLDTAVLDLRAPDLTIGTFGKIYFGNFDNVLVVVNAATPSTGAYPSADADVVIPLSAMPPPGVGKKYIKLNAATYVNTRTGRATRNQSPSLNSGNDVPTSGILRKPLHAQLLLKVPV